MAGEDSTLPSAKRIKLDLSETITLSVGPDAQKFIVYKNVAVASSDFVKAALSHDWKEAQEQCVPLPEARADHVEAWIHWLYYGVVDFERLDGYDPTACDEDEDLQNDIPLLMTNLYCFGDYITDEDFRNAITDKLIETMHQWEGQHFKAAAVQVAWEKTQPDSSIRRLLLQMWVHEAKFGYIDGLVMWETPDEFTKELCVALIVAKAKAHSSKPGDDYPNDKEKYHVRPGSKGKTDK